MSLEHVSRPLSEIMGTLEARRDPAMLLRLAHAGHRLHEAALIAYHATDQGGSAADRAKAEAMSEADRVAEIAGQVGAL